MCSKLLTMKNVITFKVTITNFTLEELKNAYRNYFGYPKTQNVTKKDIALFIAILFEADMLSILTN